MAAKVRGLNSKAILQVEEDGDIDRYGVHTITRVEMVPAELFGDLLRRVGTLHPRWTSMALSKATWKLVEAGTFYRITYIYEGFIGSIPDATYEFTGALSEEPIQTHVNFADFAGTPASPLNGAIFLDPDTGKPTTDNAKGVFFEFAAMSGDATNDLAGVSSYESRGGTFTEVSFATNRPSDLGNLGTIATPSGPHPSGGAGRNYLYAEISYRQRGFIFEIRKSWKLSGRNGWNTKIYNS